MNKPKYFYGRMIYELLGYQVSQRMLMNFIKSEYTVGDILKYRKSEIDVNSWYPSMIKE